MSSVHVQFPLLIQENYDVPETFSCLARTTDELIQSVTQRYPHLLGVLFDKTTHRCLPSVAVIINDVHQPADTHDDIQLQENDSITFVMTFTGG